VSTCIYCHTEVDWNAVLATDEGRFACDLADRHGMEALTERRQLIVLQRICAQCIDDETEITFSPETVSYACLDCGAPMEPGATMCSCRSWEDDIS
jgi:hypothetical protein